MPHYFSLPSQKATDKGFANLKAVRKRKRIWDDEDDEDSDGNDPRTGESDGTDYSIPIIATLPVEVARQYKVAGQPYDLDSVARGNVARFQLDPSAFSAQSANPNSDTAVDPND